MQTQQRHSLLLQLFYIINTLNRCQHKFGLACNICPLPWINYTINQWLQNRRGTPISCPIWVKFQLIKQAMGPIQTALCLLVTQRWKHRSNCRHDAFTDSVVDYTIPIGLPSNWTFEVLWGPLEGNNSMHTNSFGNTVNSCYKASVMRQYCI